jgi:hypothetical protein
MYDNWPIRLSRQHYTPVSLAPSEQLGVFIYGPIHDIRRFYLVGPPGFHRHLSSICTWAFTNTSSILCAIMCSASISSRDTADARSDSRSDGGDSDDADHREMDDFIMHSPPLHASATPDDLLGIVFLSRTSVNLD